MRLLLISNSTNAGEEYLKYPVSEIADFLGVVDEVLFIPYAAVTFSYDEYTLKVQKRFDEIGVRVRSVHNEPDPVLAVREACAVVVGGGNTFALVKKNAGAGTYCSASRPYCGGHALHRLECRKQCCMSNHTHDKRYAYCGAGFVRSDRCR